MPFRTYEKKEKYKYNDIDKVREWSIEKRNKNLENINPKIICDLSLENLEQFVHPDYTTLPRDQWNLK
jgi:hypothetical protein